MKIKFSFLCLLLFVFMFSLIGCEKKPTATKETPPTKVDTIIIKQENLDLTGKYMGQTIGFSSVEVKAQISGILLKRHYKRGDYVEKGELLFEIDKAQAEAAFNQANAMYSQALSALNNAEKEWERVSSLYKQNAVSAKTRDDSLNAFNSAKANVAATKASMNNAQIQLNYTNVVAPISGYTSLEAPNNGSLINAGSRLTLINKTDPMYVTFSLPGSEVFRTMRYVREGKAQTLGEGSKATITLMSNQPYSHDGKISFIDTQIDPVTNSLKARAEFPNPNGELIPNMYVEVELYGTMLKDVIVIPQSAVLHTANGSMVYKVDKDNKVSLTPVKLGDTFANLFVIDSGLAQNDQVVIKGITKITPNSVVKPTVVKLESHVIIE